MSTSISFPPTVAESLPFTNLELSSARMADPSGGFRGLIAKRNIQRGELIAVENSTFSTAIKVGGKELDSYGFICSLDPKNQLSFFSIPPNPLVSDPVKSRMSQLVPFADKDFRLAHFPFIGRAEHACAPNAVRETVSETTTHEILRAAAHIREGDRITISFVGTPLPYFERRQVLSSIFSFDCTCSLCQLPPEERANSDRRIQQVADLIESIEEHGALVSAQAQALLQVVVQAVIVVPEEAIIPPTLFLRLLFIGLQICSLLGDEVHAAEWRALVKSWTRANGKHLDDSHLPAVSDLGFSLMGPPASVVEHVASALNPPADFQLPFSHLDISESIAENTMSHKLYPSRSLVETSYPPAPGRDASPSSTAAETSEPAEEISVTADTSFISVGGAPSSVSDTTSLASTEENSVEGPSPPQIKSHPSPPSKALSQNQKRRARARAKKASSASTPVDTPSLDASSSRTEVAQAPSPSSINITTTTTKLKQTTSTVSFPSVATTEANPPSSPFPFTFASPPPSNDAALPNTNTTTSPMSPPSSPTNTTHSIPEVPSSATSHGSFSSSPKLSISQKKRAKAKAKKVIPSTSIVEDEEEEEEEQVLTSKQKKNLKARAKARGKVEVIKVEREEEGGEDEDQDATEVDEGEEEGERGRGREEKRLDRDRRSSGDGSVMGGDGEMAMGKGKEREVVG